MTIRSMRALGLVALVAAGGLLLRSNEVMQAQQPAKKLPMAQGALQCANCHTNGPVPLGLGDDEPKANDESQVVVTQKELPIWRREDLHQFAYRALSSELGKKMNEQWEKHYGRPVTQSAECLACHAVDKYPGREDWPFSKKVEAKSDAYIINEGVSCEACHGPSSGGWMIEHWQNRKGWRNYTAEKRRELGLTDLRDPAVRAATCAGCHVGSLKDGKFVTHEMYAIGHPPLQPFEVLTYSAYEPYHYKLPSAVPFFKELLKTDAGKKQLADNYHVRPGEDYESRLFAVGNVVVFRESMRLLADYADAAAKATMADGRVLDFAHFDCAACHHDLRFPAWRQTRGYDGPPGRPPRKQWVAELVDVAMSIAPDHDAAAYAKVKQELDKAVTDRVFGDPAAIADAARKLQGWADVSAKKLNGIKYVKGKDGAKDKLLAGVESYLKRPKSDHGLVDYDRATQLVWARDRLMSDKLDPLLKPKKEIPGLPPLHLRYFLPKRMSIDALLGARLNNAREFDAFKFYDALAGGKGIYGPTEPVPDEPPTKDKEPNPFEPKKKP